jgi:GntR family histidine utilization transcriptional repressor
MQPRFVQIKSSLLEQIENGQMTAGDKVPSENQLAESFGVSRMTSRRALSELVAEGILLRSQGLGTFVADHRPMTSMLEIKSINDEITQRGHAYSNRLITVQRVIADERQSVWMGIGLNSELFHTSIVHLENNLAIQLEERWVNPLWAPDYLQVDFSHITANQYLSKVAPLTQADHVIEAILPTMASAALLNISADQPCLQISRSTYSAKGIVSYALLTHPGNRYRMGAHLDFPHSKQDK